MVFKVNSDDMHRQAVTWAARQLNLRECDPIESLGLLCDDQQRTYLVRSRTVPAPGWQTSFNFRRKPNPFDFFVGVIFERDPLRPTLGMKVRWADFDRHLVYNQDGPRFRWSKNSPINEAIIWIRQPDR